MSCEGEHPSDECTCKEARMLAQKYACTNVKMYAQHLASQLDEFIITARVRVVAVWAQRLISVRDS